MKLQSVIVKLQKTIWLNYWSCINLAINNNSQTFAIILVGNF